MASSLPLKAFLLLVCLSVLLPQLSVSTSTNTNLNHHQVHNHGLEIDKISNALSDKGYIAMSIILQATLSSLLSSENTTTFTVFCPPDKAFFTPKYPQPPLTLVKYHIVPTNLDRESLESSLPYESKIDTLLHGHPLVVTTTPHRRHASINDVKVTDWDIYNDDGRVIVHGVEDFFDPAFQTLLYPWYDSNNNKNGDNSKGIETTVSSNSGSATFWVKDMVMEKFFIMLAVVAFAGAVFSLGCFYRKNRRQYSDYGHIITEVQKGYIVD